MFTNKRNLYNSSTSIIHVSFILHPNQEKPPKKKKNRVVYVTSPKFQFHPSLSACFIHLCSNIFSPSSSLFFSLIAHSSIFYFFLSIIIINYPRTLYKPSINSLSSLYAPPQPPPPSSSRSRSPTLTTYLSLH